MIGMVIALGTVGFFALLVNWPGLLSLTWRPVLGIGGLFGLLAGVFYTAPDPADDPEPTLPGHAWALRK